MFFLDFEEESHNLLWQNHNTHFCCANHNDLFSQKVQCLLSSFCTLCIYWHFFHSPDTATYLEREAVAIVDCF